MTILLLVASCVGLVVVGVTLAVWAVTVGRALVARAEIQARQRRAEAEMQHLVQDTISRLFDAARRPQ